MSALWRVGAKIPLNVYEGDRPVCRCHSEEDARQIVAAMNRSDMEALKSGNVKSAALDKFADVVMARNEDVETIRTLREALNDAAETMKTIEALQPGLQLRPLIERLKSTACACVPPILPDVDPGVECETCRAARMAAHGTVRP